MTTRTAVVVGAGHNGLVAATLLARWGWQVWVVERDQVVGGACRTEYPFAAAPELGASTGAYLLGAMPPEVIEELGLALPLIRRDPHYFLPTLDGRYLEVGSSGIGGTLRLDAHDRRALDAYEAELAALREDLAAAWLSEPASVEAIADRFVRRELRQVFLDLVRGSAGAYLDRFGFRCTELEAMALVTDAFPGLCGTVDTPGSGANLLVHQMCRLPGSDGTWMVVAGGMGTVTARLAALATDAGVRLLTGHEVAAIRHDGEQVAGVSLDDGTDLDASVVVVNADPFRLRELVGPGALGAEFEARIDAYRARPGTTLKVNLALADLPRFAALPEPQGQHGATIHLLPERHDRDGLRACFAQAAAGELPADPPIELYIHTATDPSLRDPQGRHSAALFVQWVPPEPAAGSWAALADRYVDHLLAQVDRYAPGFSRLVVDRDVLPPPEIERRFGIRGANIFHVDNSVPFGDRLPYRLPIAGLYACGAGCYPAGSVTGVPGRNAAHAVRRDRS